MPKEELINIKGGSGFSASLVNALVRMYSTSLELGRTLGTIIRRNLEGKKCN